MYCCMQDKEIEDEEGLKPYKTDLEYLDDHFAVRWCVCVCVYVCV